MSDKANAFSKMFGIPKTRAFDMFADSFFMAPKISIHKKPRSKKKVVKLYWEKEYEF